MNRVVTLLVASCLLIAGCLGEDKDIFYGDDINPPVSVEDFILIDENGEEFSFSDLEGKVIVVAFLFTRCPDICPVVSANMNYVSQELGDLYGTEVAMLSITVDPWRDNSSIMHSYAEQRGLDWPHLTTASEDLSDFSDLSDVWSNFGVGLETNASDLDSDSVADLFDSCPDTPEGEAVDDRGCGLETQQSEGDVSVKHHPLTYWVDHTTGTIIVDKQMRQRVWWGDADWIPELVLEDIYKLLEE